MNHPGQFKLQFFLLLKEIRGYQVFGKDVKIKMSEILEEKKIGDPSQG